MGSPSSPTAGGLPGFPVMSKDSRVRSIARRVLAIQTAVLVTLVYFTVVPLVAWIRLRDPLGARGGRKDSYWLPHHPVKGGVERHTHPF